ncbi:hypothetical protein HXX76_013441 [Chlamydomonas incerta]|uniref:Uncharacterized protein n=1 Tax=Chlamydomonas incerta TaxID=51695 RepID=A0A835VUN2_CHLIN|nr:hypothetical protein HXX76_013441 [Chlamydomonas incerta]|eukprot:KAG2425816.1 hypothetical protein HXX76_013441 [Chlamydomonas incerta]
MDFRDELPGMPGILDHRLPTADFNGEPMQARRMSMPGEMPGLGHGPSFSFPALNPHAMPPPPGASSGPHQRQFSGVGGGGGIGSPGGGYGHGYSSPGGPASAEPGGGGAPSRLAWTTSAPAAGIEAAMAAAEAAAAAAAGAYPRGSGGGGYGHGLLGHGHGHGHGLGHGHSYRSSPGGAGVGGGGSGGGRSGSRLGSPATSIGGGLGSAGIMSGGGGGGGGLGSRFSAGGYGGGLSLGGLGGLAGAGGSGAFGGPLSPHMLSPRHPLSRGNTPLQSGLPTPRSSMNGSVFGSPSDYGGASGGVTGGGGGGCLSDTASTRALGKALSGVERGLDTPLWVRRLRLVGRLLLAALFANLLAQELGEWRTLKGYGWREWYDLSWVADEIPPLPALLSGLALMALMAGVYTSLAAGWLAARLAVQCFELWEEIIAVLQEQTSNLLPVKELAVVGTVIVFIGHTYYVPDWVRDWARGGGAKAKGKGKAKGLMYTQQWRPGQQLIMLAGRLLVAPLFISICALQYYDITSSAEGLSRWKARLLAPRHWLPPGDSSTNNWLPAQAAAYVLLVTGISNKRVPALLAALLVAEAFTCWRFWASVWLSKHYVCYLRRHFTANLAIAGGLLLNLPQGRHDAGSGREAPELVGKKRT